MKLNGRRQGIMDALLEAGTASVDDLVAAVYTDVDPERHPIARHSTYAHLLKLRDEGTVKGDDLDGKWTTA